MNKLIQEDQCCATYRQAGPSLRTELAPYTTSNLNHFPQQKPTCTLSCSGSLSMQLGTIKHWA